MYSNSFNKTKKGALILSGLVLVGKNQIVDPIFYCCRYKMVNQVFKFFSI